MTSLDELAALVRPPTDARGRGVDWATVFGQVGRLPDDYVAIWTAYGPGLFAGELGLFSPTDLPVCGRQSVEGGLTIIGDNDLGDVWVLPDGSTEPVVIDPALPYLGWGGGPNGQDCFWHKTGDDPNTWPVIVTDLATQWDRHPGGLAAYLVDLLSGRFPSAAFDDLFSESAVLDHDGSRQRSVRFSTSESG
jgi:hypothetical protein